MERFEQPRRRTGARNIYRIAALFALTTVIAVAFVRYDESIVSGLFGDRQSIDDGAGLLSEEQRSFVTRYHALLLKNHDIDYRILTVAEPVDINRFSAAQFRALGVGGASRSGRGLLLVLDPLEDKVRLEVSAALEGVYPDAFAAYLEQRQMVYFFTSGRVADGILAATELIFSRARQAEADQAFELSSMPHFSTGAGAATAAHLNRPLETSFPSRAAQAEVAVGGSPLQTVEAYLDAMARRDSRPDLEIYTQETRAMLANWTVTPAQMDHVVAAFGKCPPPEVQEEGGYAVVRYPPEARQCSPWFLQQQAGGWKLDLTVMQKSLGFNHENQWHFPNGVLSHYAFAFADWRFDRHGFPHGSR